MASEGNLLLEGRNEGRPPIGDYALETLLKFRESLKTAKLSGDCQ